MALLDVRNVTMKFGELVANDRVSFTVESGSIVGLIGPNGAGKTTLFNCVTGFLKPTGGAIIFDGADITGYTPYQIARLGAVRTFQVVRPLKEMTVFDNVLVGAFLKTSDNREAFARAADCIRLCSLESFQEKPAGELSIGGKKRLELARALATQPKLLMLDEVMAGLTSTEVRVSVEVILRLRESGITLMIVEHVMEGIMPIADKIVVLDGGVKIAEDAPGKIINDDSVIEAYLGAKYAQRFKAQKEDGARG
ncbi:MAG: branched-chain amino acid transport system ATP-binding protein [Thermodesulfobacteriota bacterium]|jgi:branched-chain amino acid transport system ATP-binding protein|nr:branched-chain amino acid transport system ATP-binding protein [Thermodesulfobacteriota bacterium]